MSANAALRPEFFRVFGNYPWVMPDILTRQARSIPLVSTLAINPPPDNR